LRVDFTPLARKISVRQAILNLAGFDVVVVDSFPRFADIQLVPDCSAICFSMDDDDLIRFNGIDVDRAMIGIGHGGSSFSIMERTGARLASIFFTPEIHDRGWPESGRQFPDVSDDELSAAKTQAGGFGNPQAGVGLAGDAGAACHRGRNPGDAAFNCR
jgi:hypothetical protein